MISAFSSLWDTITFNNPNKNSSISAYRSNSKPLPAKVKKMTHFSVDIAFQSFEDGGRHLTAKQLDLYRQVGDPTIDNILEEMEKAGCPLKANGDLLFAKPGTYPETIETMTQDLKDYHSKLPSWVSVDRLRNGQMVFVRYFVAAGASLTYRSLISGFSIPKIGKVIKATAYLAPPSSQEQVALRLIDTFSLLAACAIDIESILSGGEGWKTALYVRVLHAKVRRALLKRQGDAKWNRELYGIPINQEDMAATLLAFSINTLDGIEFLAGMQLSRKEKEDYLHYWRYIGWLLGVHTSDVDEHLSDLKILDPCGIGWYPENPDPIHHAHSLLESMLLHLCHPNDLSVEIAHHLLQYRLPRDDKVRKSNQREIKNGLMFYFRSLICRKFIGDGLADALELPIYQTWWRRIFVKHMAFLYFWSIRLCTWGGILRISFLYTSTYQMIQRFRSIWKERHPTRMAKAMRKNHGTQVGSCCPFAMIKPPE